jgi:site-specific recombinase XerD
MEGQEKTPKLMEQVRSTMRLHHYSIHTERSYCDWIKRYMHFHKMRCREDLTGGEAKMEAFLTDLAINGKVSPATQNQAMNALVFLYKRVLLTPLDGTINAVRADRKATVPVVLTPEEVKRVISVMEGVPQLIVKMLYGSGLRIMEAVRLRVKDVDFQMKQVTVRGGKGDRDRMTTLSAAVSKVAKESPAHWTRRAGSWPRSALARRLAIWRNKFRVPTQG